MCNNIKKLFLLYPAHNPLHNPLRADSREATIITIAAIPLTINGAWPAFHVELQVGGSILAIAQKAASRSRCAPDGQGLQPHQ